MTRRWMVLNGVLVVIVLGLAFQIVRAWSRTLPPVEVRSGGKGADVPTRTGEGGKRSKRSQADKTTQAPAAMVATIADKDLFDPSRTKPSEETKGETAVHETTPPPGISLVGIRIHGKDSEGFILDATQANTQRRIRAGDTVGNFIVRRIRSSSVVLVSSAGDFVTLTLEVDKSKGGAPGGTTPPGRPGRQASAAAAAGGGATSPAAGPTGGASPAAGIGGTKPPVVAAGTAAAPPQPPAPAPPPPPGPGRKAQAPPVSPNLPEGVRQKLEQMRNQGKK